MTVSPGFTPAYPKGWFTIHFGIAPEHVSEVISDLQHQFGLREAFVPNHIGSAESVVVDEDDWIEWGERPKNTTDPLHMQVVTPYLARAVEIEHWIIRTYGTDGTRWLSLTGGTPVYTAISTSEDWSTTREVAALVTDLRYQAAQS